jgi:uncharacterized protein (DUF885 family)
MFHGVLLSQSTQISVGDPDLAANLYLLTYGEGWAAYAEQLANEIGLNDDNPLGRASLITNPA